MILNDDEGLAFLDTLYILRRTGRMQQIDILDSRYLTNYSGVRFEILHMIQKGYSTCTYSTVRSYEQCIRG